MASPAPLPSPEPTPTRVGVGVFLARPDGSFLVGHRVSTHGYDTWGLVGGHVEFGEDPAETAQRETLEKTGLLINNVKFMGYSSSVFENNNRHYITLFFIAHVSQSTIPNVCEPDKTDIWKYVTLNTLPSNLLKALSDYIKNDKAVIQKHLSSS